MSYSIGALAGIEPATCELRVRCSTSELQGGIRQLPDPDTQIISDGCVSPQKTRSRCDQSAMLFFHQ